VAKATPDVVLCTQDPAVRAMQGTSERRPCARCRGRGLFSRHTRTDRTNDGQS
jgi:hypothetical protein